MVRGKDGSGPLSEPSLIAISDGVADSTRLSSFWGSVGLSSELRQERRKGRHILFIRHAFEIAGERVRVSGAIWAPPPMQRSSARDMLALARIDRCRPRFGFDREKSVAIRDLEKLEEKKSRMDAADRERERERE